jgi:Tfp pilus assembly protein PilO
VNEKQRWTWLLGGGAAAIGLLSWGIHGVLAEVRTLEQKIAGLRGTIAASHRTVEELPTLEEQVIIARAVAPAVERCLPESEDVHELVHRLHLYSREAGVRITGYRRRADPPARRAANQRETVQRAAYTFTLEAGAFQFLAFLERVENHPRFLSVPNIKLTAARRQSLEKDGLPWHRIQMDVQTYRHGTQTNGAGAKASATIPDVERKSVRLADAVIERRLALAVPPVPYAGARGRRDPWVDPRHPREEPDAFEIIEKNREQEFAQSLERRAQRLRRAWDRMVADGELGNGGRVAVEVEMGSIEGELRRAQLDRSLTDELTAARLQTTVLAVLKDLAREMSRREVKDLGVERAELLAILGIMQSQMGREDWDAALAAGRGAESLLREARARQQHRGLVEAILRLGWGARTSKDLAALRLELTGIVCLGGRASVALVNGQSVTVGDRLGQEVIVCDIRPGEVEFEFRGVRLSRDL